MLCSYKPIPDGKKKIPNKLPIWDLHSGAARLVDDDRFSSLIHVVIQSKVGCHPMDQHPLIRWHLGELFIVVTGTGLQEEWNWHLRFMSVACFTGISTSLSPLSRNSCRLSFRHHRTPSLTDKFLLSQIYWSGWARLCCFAATHSSCLLQSGLV